MISTERPGESVKTDEAARNDPFIPGSPLHLLRSRSPSSFLGDDMMCITPSSCVLSTWLSLRFLPFLRTCIVPLSKRIGPRRAPTLLRCENIQNISHPMNTRSCKAIFLRFRLNRRSSINHFRCNRRAGWTGFPLVSVSF